MKTALTSFLALLALSLPAATLATSVEEEVALGEKEHRKVIAQMGAYRDPALQAYVTRVGQRIAAVSSRPELEYHFTVLDSGIINAFALPGGFIYVTRGMLMHMNSESELAAVLGHEIAHVTEKHALRRQSRQKGLSVLNSIIWQLTGQPGLYELGNMFGGVLLSGYSRDFELEADEAGAQFMAKAGYSPEAMIDTIDILKAKDRVEILHARQENREPAVYHGFLSSHPDHDTRYELAIRESKRLLVEDDEFIKGGEFLEKLNGLAYGPSKQTGVVRGSVFYHPKLGFKFTFPEGWRFEAGARGIAVVSPVNDASFSVETARYARGMTAEEVAVEGIGLTLREGRAITIAGLPAFLGIADDAHSPYGPRPVRFAVILDTVRGIGYKLAGAGKHDLRKIADDPAFIATIFSFDRMDPEDFRKAMRPSVQVVRAEEGTTMEALAAESPITNYALDKLRVMNGLYPKGQPEPGQLIKIVN